MFCLLWMISCLQLCTSCLFATAKMTTTMGQYPPLSATTYVANPSGSREIPGVGCSGLVVWNMNFIFHHIWDVILPIDELIFFRGVGQPPTPLLMVSKNCEATPDPPTVSVTSSSNIQIDLAWSPGGCFNREISIRKSIYVSPKHVGRCR